MLASDLSLVAFSVLVALLSLEAGVSAVRNREEVENLVLSLALLCFVGLCLLSAFVLRSSAFSWARVLVLGVGITLVYLTYPFGDVRRG